MDSFGDGEEGAAKPATALEGNANSDSGAAQYAQPIGERNGDSFNEMGWIGEVSDMEDTVPVFDDCETQVLEFGEDTQLVGDEPDRFEDMESTQLVDDVAADSDMEFSEWTEKLSCYSGGHDDELLDGESARKGRADLLVEEKKETMDQASGFSSDGPSGAMRLTSVRTASFRASGLAARKMALERIRNPPVQSNGGSSEVNLAEIDGSELNACNTVYTGFATGRCDNEAKRLNCGSKCKIGSSTVRKLFTEDVLNETGTLTYDEGMAACTKELELPHNDGLAGLSYVDSQEPGEASQANALACVQKLIDESKDLFYDEFDLPKSDRGKKSGLSSLKGSESLAKKANAKGTSASGSVFDWDDRYEDEGGGEIFSRKKDEFFGSTRKITSKKSQKSKKHLHDECLGNEGKADYNNAAMVREMGSSGFERNGKTAKGNEKCVVRDLVGEFDEVIAQEQAVEQFDATSSAKSMRENLHVGIDTQMAAEAMEALFNGEGNGGQKGSSEDIQIGSSGRKSEKTALPKQNCSESVLVDRVLTRKSRMPQVVNANSGERSSASSKKHGSKLKTRPDRDMLMTRQKRAKCDTKEAVMTRREKQSEKLNTLHNQDLVMTRSKRAKFNVEKAEKAYERKVCPQMPKEIVEQTKEAGPPKDELIKKSAGVAHDGCLSTKKRHMPEEFSAVSPIARRTRRSLVQSNDNGINLGMSSGFKNYERENGTNEQIGASHECTMTSRALIAKKKSSELEANNSERHGNLISKPRANGDGISCFRRRRSLRNISGRLDKIDRGDTQLKAPVPLKNVEPQSKCMAGQSRLKEKVSNAEISGIKSQPMKATFVSLDSNSHAGFDDKVTKKAASFCDSSISKALKAKPTSISDSRDDRDAILTDKSKGAASPNMISSMKAKELKSACTSPDNCMAPAKVVSPVCMGNGYVDQSCKKGLPRTSLFQEINGLRTTRMEPFSTPKDSRKRRDLSSVKVLFSQHLDDDVLKPMRKIAERLGVSMASTISDATHFIADEFVRTRNMLVAIAGGKPVVTHQWLEDVGQAKYFIDEQKYILRDAKKEKEISFNMSVSLTLARKSPLLQGRRVFITCNVKPGKDIVSRLVKEVHGQAVERVGRSTSKDDKTPDDLLIISCEEDYETCLPFLEKGLAVYSSELLLNGIVTQKLEYERYTLFSDHVKRTRSTVWLKKDGRTFVPVKKQK